MVHLWCSPLQLVPHRVVVCFTLLQLVYLLGVWALTTWAGIAGVAFPLPIMALVPVRQYLLPLLFKQQHLAQLDAASYEEAPGITDRAQAQQVGEMAGPSWRTAHEYGAPCLGLDISRSSSIAALIVYCDGAARCKHKVAGYRVAKSLALFDAVVPFISLQCVALVTCCHATSLCVAVGAVCCWCPD